MNFSPKSPQSLIILLSTLLLACTGLDKSNTPKENPESQTISADTTTNPAQISQPYQDPFADLNVNAQIMLVLRRLMEDQTGRLWIVGDGVFCYDGDSLYDFSEQPVFRKNVIRQIKEDQVGNIWFGTYQGIVKYDLSKGFTTDSTAFSQFSLEEGLVGNDVWSMAIDSDGNLWVGTLDGLSLFEPSTKAFTTVDLPETEIDETRGVTSSRIVHSIMEDREGKMWFATNGGVFIHDGTALRHVGEQDGLCHNVVNHILEDGAGNIWFATHHDGVCRLNLEEDEGTFHHISAEHEISGKEAWSLYEDQAGNIWFPIENEGMYRYNPGTKTIENFHKKEGLMMGGVHTVVEDSKGRYWFGGFGGLYFYDPANKSGEAGDPKPIINVTMDGPWPD